jgi:hypothetical protein
MTRMTLEWTSHPAKRRPQDVMLAACVILLSAWAVLIGLQSAWLAVVAAILLVAAIAPFLLPTRYRIDGDGIAERRLWVTRTRRWTELQRLDVGRAAALVSPYARPRWLDRYRGLVIYFDGAERTAVVRALESRLAPGRLP